MRMEWETNIGLKVSDFKKELSLVSFVEMKERSV
jgi:hypothetical protein